MARKINIAIYALLLTFVVTVAYGPTGEEKEKTDTESRLMRIEKKLDKLIEDKESTTQKLDGMVEHLKKIESLIRTRT
jgi:hypothetical protein